jgi:predicted GIY-YIG superfamily endonuclease
MNHNNCDEVKIRYVYILEIDNRGSKSKFYGHRKIYYTGQTDNLVRRFKEHIKGINSKFLNKNFKDSKKIIVFVTYVVGTEYDSLIFEHKVKSMNKNQKKDLIASDDNYLIEYKPLQMIILRHIDDKDKRYFMPFDKKGYESF